MKDDDQQFPSATTVVLPAGSDLTFEEAKELDAAIDAGLDARDALLRVYLETGHRLARMQATKGYAAMGFRTWGSYLDSKERYGRTFLSYLLKLGHAGNPEAFLERGIKPATLIHYISQVGYPEKVSTVIEATWDEVKDLSPKEAAKRIGQFVDVHAAEFKKPRRRREALAAAATGAEDEPAGAADLESPGGKVEPLAAAEPPCPAVGAKVPTAASYTAERDWEASFEAEFASMSEEEQHEYFQAMRRFLSNHD